MKFIIDYLVEKNILGFELYESILIIQFFILLLIFAIIISYDLTQKYYYNKSTETNTTVNIFQNNILNKVADDLHSKRVSNLSVQIAKAIGLSPKEIDEIRIVGLMHDAGKSTIPSEILNKEGKLTTEEWDIIRKHSEHGYDLLSSEVKYAYLAKYVLQHHERIDGKGYPHGIKGDEIELYSRIIAVADAYDAMTTDRVYSKAKTKQESMEEIRNFSGTQFDPHIANAFLNIVLEGH